MNKSYKKGVFCLKKMLTVGLISLFLIILLLPIPHKLKDGGTIEYTAILYKVSDVHSFAAVEQKLGCNEGIIIEVLGLKIFDNVRFVSNQTDSKFYLEAIVLTVSNNYATVIPYEKDVSPDYNNQIVLSLENIKLQRELRCGDIVRVVYDGLILESYPAQITTISEIEILQQQNTQINVSDVWVSYANYSNDRCIFEYALNKSVLQKPTNSDLPIYKFDTLQDLNKFKYTFKDIFSMNSKYDEQPSFNEITTYFDEAFFQEKTLLLTYVTATSGSDRYGFENIMCIEDYMCIYVKKLNSPDAGTCDMAGWFIVIAIDDNVAENYSNITARI